MQIFKESIFCDDLLNNKRETLKGKDLLLKENSASMSEDSEGVLNLLSRMLHSRTSEGLKNIG